MIKCESCAKEISPKADKCPGCGHPVPGDKVFAWFLTIFFGLPIILMVLAAMLLPSSRPAPTTREEQIRQLSDDTGISMSEIRQQLDRIEGR